MLNKKNSAAYATRAGVIAALYVTLTLAQQFLLPGSTSLSVQFRLSEMLNMLCVFTPCAVPGLTIGCLLSNIMNVGLLPLDCIFGTAATFLGAIGVRKLRFIKIKGLPILSCFMPAISNGIFIGSELALFYVQEPLHWKVFLWQALLVFLGEAAVCLLLGLPFVYVYNKRFLYKK